MFYPKDITRDLVNEIWDGDYRIVAAGDNAPGKNKVIAFGKSYGVKFPKDYISHSTGKMGGLFIEVKEELWPYAKEFDVAPFWTFLRGFYSYAYGDEAPDWLQIKVAAEEFKEMGHKVVPVLKVWSDPNVYCYNEKGELVRYSHDEDIFEKTNKTWFELLQYELKELSQRKKKKLKEKS